FSGKFSSFGFSSIIAESTFGAGRNSFREIKLIIFGSAQNWTLAANRFILGGWVVILSATSFWTVRMIIWGFKTISSSWRSKKPVK
ncbi:MAG: hypothetical protein Q8O49_01210, partial [bacterium]|nr:hypothetical protein [bacterium]